MYVNPFVVLNLVTRGQCLNTRYPEPSYLWLADEISTSRQLKNEKEKVAVGQLFTLRTLNHPHSTISGYKVEPARRAQSCRTEDVRGGGGRRGGGGCNSSNSSRSSESKNSNMRNGSGSIGGGRTGAGSGSPPYPIRKL